MNIYTCISVFMLSTGYYCQNLKINFIDRSQVKISKSKHKNNRYLILHIILSTGYSCQNLKLNFIDRSQVKISKSKHNNNRYLTLYIYIYI